MNILRTMIILFMFVFLTNGYICATSNNKIIKSKKEIVVITAYCPCKKCCGRWAKYKKTATQKSALLPGVAVDPKYFPLKKTFFNIPGYNRNDGKLIEADDTGGKVKGLMRKDKNSEKRPHLDLRFEKHPQAVKWGIQEVEVEVITYEEQ